MDAGSVTIVGKLDISQIQRGQREISVGFDTMKQKTQSSFGSMELLSSSAASLGTSLAKVGGLALTGLTGLAGLTPVLADEFAKMKVETFKLAQVIGSELEPAIQYGLDKFTEFVSFMQGNSGLSEFTKDLAVLVGAGGLLTLLTSKIGILKGLSGKIIPIAVAVTLLKNFENLVDEGENFAKSAVQGVGAEEDGFVSDLAGIIGRIATAAGTGALSFGLVGGAVSGGTAALPAAGLGAIAGGGYEAYQLWNEWITGQSESQTRVYNETKNSTFYDVDTIG